MRAGRLRETLVSPASPDAFAFFDCDVAIYRYIGESFHLAGGLWPLDFDEIELLDLSNAENHPRIMARQEAAATRPQAGTSLTAESPANPRTDRVDIAPPSNQANAEPVIPPSHLIVEQQWF